jgi:O-antigen ligase
MVSSPITTNLFSRAAGHRWLAIGLAVVCALVLGIAVGQGQWLFVAALAAIPLVFLWPVQVALGTFALLIPFDSSGLTEGGSGRTLNWFVGAAAASILIITALAARTLHKPPRAALWWAILVAWCSLTALWAVDPRPSLLRLPTAGACLLLYLAAASLRVREIEFKGIVGSVIVGGCLAGAYASYQFYHGVGWGGGVRSSFVFGASEVNPNLFATRLLLPLALAVGAYFASRSGLRKTIMLCISALLTLSVLLTLSRGAALAVLVMAAVFLLRFGVNRRLLAVSALFAVITMTLPSEFFKRVGEAGATGGAGRLDIWRVGWELLKHYGIFGAGLGNFPVVYSRYAGYAPHFVGFNRASHNLYLEIAVEAGIIGILLLMQAVRVQLWAGRNNRSRAGKPNVWLVACEAAGWSIMTSAMFGQLFWEKSFWLLWIMVALSTQLYGNSFQNGEKRERQEPPGMRPRSLVLR